jgi:hypothetical protein
MRSFPVVVRQKKSVGLLAWGLGMMALGAGFGWAQETMVDYALTAPLVVEGKNGVVVERLRFRRRLPSGEAAVQIRNSQNVVLRACAFSGIGAAILVEASREVRVEDCAFIDLWDPGVAGLQPRIAVEARNSQQVSVSDSLFEFVASGLYAYQSQGVVFTRNTVMNILGPFPRGQAVQFNGVSGPGNRIAGNFVRNEAGVSQPQDCVNLFQSSGTAESPILVEENYLTGDPVQGSQGKSSSGSGIMAGDGGGGFQIIRNNRLDSPGQVGIGVASGREIQICGNTVRGVKSDVSNVGIAVWNQYRAPGGPVVVVSNVVGWTDRNGKPNGIWVGKAKYGPLYEFSEIRASDNEIRFPESIQVEPEYVPASWTMVEGVKYSRQLRQARGDLQKLFEPIQD